VRRLRLFRGIGRGGSPSVFSLVPLIVLSVLAAVLMTQSSVTLANSYFQSPQSPVSTPMPPAQPTGEVPQPPEESPAVPPGETPGEVPPPPVVPEASPSEGTPAEEGPSDGVPVEEDPSERAPDEEAIEEPPSGEEGSLSVGDRSLAVLIDTCVVGLSSVWLCLGALALVAFVLLVIASFLLRVR